MNTTEQLALSMTNAIFASTPIKDTIIGRIPLEESPYDHNVLSTDKPRMLTQTHETLEYYIPASPRDEAILRIKENMNLISPRTDLFKKPDGTWTHIQPIDHEDFHDYEPIHHVVNEEALEWNLERINRFIPQNTRNTQRIKELTNLVEYYKLRHQLIREEIAITPKKARKELTKKKREYSALTSYHQKMLNEQFKIRDYQLQPEKQSIHENLEWIFQPLPQT